MTEKINVYARSTGGKIVPIQFIFNNQLYTVREVVQYKKDRLKSKLLFHFKVKTAPNGEYEMLFDLSAGQWLLIGSKHVN